MRHLAFLIAAALPLTAQAEQAVIRIEAKRTGAAETAQGWAAQFPDVVTFPAKGGWTAIALGPMEKAEAEARMKALKAEKKIPADSFLGPVEEGVTPVAPTGAAMTGAAATPDAGAEAAAPTDAAPAETAPADAPVAAHATPGSTMPAKLPEATTPPAAAPAPEAPAAEDAPADAGAADQAPPAEATPAPAVDPAPAPEPAHEPAPAADPAPAPAATAEPAAATAAPSAATAEPAAAPAPASFIRLASFKTRADADAALAETRLVFPEAGLHELPSGGFAVTLGPVAPETGAAWVQALRTAGRAGKEAGVVSAEKLGAPTVPGADPKLPAPEQAAMPPLDQVQHALRWAGVYDGAVDGKDGPRTRDAIASAIVTLRLPPEPGAAMARLIADRESWRNSADLMRLDDASTGLSVTAPMSRLEFDRTERGLSIYRPRNESGAALILFSQPGGQREMLDMAGLVTALGWVPSPRREEAPGRVTLDGRNATHIGHAEGRVLDGRAEGYVLIWPVEDAAEQPRIAAEIADSLTRFGPAANDTPPADAGSEAAEADPAAAPSN